jgi:hypothetical protein
MNETIRLRLTKNVMNDNGGYYSIRLYFTPLTFKLMGQPSKPMFGN